MGINIKFLILIYSGILGFSKSAASSENDINEQIWHSYEFGTGVRNREEPHFSIVELKEYFTLNNVYKWKTIKVKGEIIIVGLGKNFIGISNYDSENTTFEKREDILEDTTDFITFQRWDGQSQSLKNYIVVSAAQAAGNNCTDYLLKWYTVEDNNLIFLSDWSFYNQITFLDSVIINNELKLLIFSQQGDGQNNNAAGEIYSFKISPRLDIWLFERVSFNFTPSSISTFSDIENAFLLLSFPQINTIQVWKYSEVPCLQSEKHFNLHQNISAINLKSLNTFTVGYRWYLIIASKQPSVYELKENRLFYPLYNVTVENVDNWFVLPIDNFREDKILVATSEKGLIAAPWRGNGKGQIYQNITQNLCRNGKVFRVSIMNSASFSFDEYQVVVMPTENGTSLIMKLRFQLQPLPDVKVVQLNALLGVRKLLEEKYSNLKNKIKELNENDKPLIETKAASSGVEISHEQVENKEELEVLSSTKNWTEAFATVKILNSKMDSLMNDMRDLQSQLHNSSKFKSSEDLVQQKSFPEGITFYGNVVINNLNATVLNGFKTSDLLKNLYRKGSEERIGGVKTLKNVVANHVNFEKVKNISSCDIIYADDSFEGKSFIVNGDVIFENSLNIDGDIEIINSDSVQVASSKSKPTIPNVQKSTFDELEFEELEITGESDILTSINSQPLILPVHNLPLDMHYLNVSNEVRIEHVNVQSDLEVISINGQNFNNLTNQILFKNKNREEGFKRAKINGVLSVDSLAVGKIIPKAPNSNERTSNLEVKLSGSDSNSADDFGKMSPQNSQNNERKRKRKIHVYQNLEVDGVVHTNRINNLDWSLLNDTIRKGSKAVIKGKKLFKETVTANKINIGGTINDVNPENILNKLTEQSIPFPQTFSKVEFKNLTLKGTWDGVDLKNFNLSSVNPSELEGNLSLRNCSLVTDTLEVTDFINGITLKNWDGSKGQNVSVESLASIKFINASQVTIDGSLFTDQGINNVNISGLNERRVSKSRSQIIRQNISLNDFDFNGAINVVKVNGKDVSNILKPGGDIRTIEKFLRGETNKIKQLLVRGEIKTANGINGHDLSNLASNGIRITENNFIDDSLIFEDLVHFDKLNVTGTINNIDLGQLENDLVFQRDSVFLNSAKNFTRLKVLQDAKIRSLNGHFVEDIVTLEGHHVLKGNLQVNGNVIVRGNISSNGAINDIVIPVFLRKYSAQYNSYVFSEDLYLSSRDVNINNLWVGGKIQNADFEALMKKAVTKDESFNAIGSKLFQGEVTFNGNVYLEKAVNGSDMSELLGDIVMVDEPAKIEGTVTIEEAAFNTVDVGEYFNSSLINGIDMNDWFEESIPLDEENVNVNGEMTFENPLAMENVEVDFINGQISSAVILRNEKQHIPISISFQNVNLTSDLSVGRFVNGKNLLEEYEDSILVNESQVIEGASVFLNDFTINGNLSMESVKGKLVNDLITLDNPQTITNVLDFQGSFVANKGLKHLNKINNIDLIDWNNRSILLNREQEINGFWEVKKNIKAKYIDGEALVGSASLFNVSKDFVENKRKAVDRKNETEVEYYKQCRRVERLSETFTKQPYVFNHFEVSEIIETPLIIESVIPFKISNSEFLIITFANNCLSSLYKWDKNEATFTRERQINIGPVTKWLVLYQHGTTYLITSASDGDVDCEEDILPGNIWAFENYNKYKHLYTTDSFIDAVQDNDTSQTFFTLEKGGAVFQWFIENGTNISYKLLVSLGQENYKFIDKGIFSDLAVSNGREIKVLKSVNGKIVVDSFYLHNNNIVALPMVDKTLAAVVINDKIVVYKNLMEDQIFSVIHTFRANSVLWFYYGFEREAFLIVSSRHRLIEVYEYKGVSGFVKRSSLPLLSTKLQTVSLPLKNKFQLLKFIIAVHKKKIVFLKAEMLGDFFETTDSLC